MNGPTNIERKVNNNNIQQNINSEAKPMLLFPHNITDFAPYCSTTDGIVPNIPIIPYNIAQLGLPILQIGNDSIYSITNLPKILDSITNELHNINVKIDGIVKEQKEINTKQTTLQSEVHQLKNNILVSQISSDDQIFNIAS